MQYAFTWILPSKHPFARLAACMAPTSTPQPRGPTVFRVHRCSGFVGLGTSALIRAAVCCAPTLLVGGYCLGPALDDGLLAVVRLDAHGGGGGWGWIGPTDSWSGKIRGARGGDESGGLAWLAGLCLGTLRRSTRAGRVVRRPCRARCTAVVVLPAWGAG
jgi:hypothetical protein